MVSRKQYLCLNCKAHGFEIGKKGHDCSIYLNCPHRCKVCKDVRVAHLASRINYKKRQQIDIRSVKKSFDCGVQAAKRRLAAREAHCSQNKPKGGGVHVPKKVNKSSGQLQNSKIRVSHVPHSFQTSTDKAHDGCSSLGFQTSTNQNVKSGNMTSTIRMGHPHSLTNTGTPPTEIRCTNSS